MRPIIEAIDAISEYVRSADNDEKRKASFLGAMTALKQTIRYSAPESGVTLWREFVHVLIDLYPDSETIGGIYNEYLTKFEKK